MMKAQMQSQLGVDWSGATLLIARIIVLLGLGLALLGFGRTLLVLFEVARGVETVANIESAVAVPGAGGRVDLSWRDPGGEMRMASGVGVSRLLARKLRLGYALSRANLRIRYAASARSGAAQSVVVMDDVPDLIKRSAALAIGGFLAITAGSMIMVGLLLLLGATAAPRGTTGADRVTDGVVP